MSKEELIGKLQTVYVGDINALNEMIGYYDGLKQGIEELQQENKILKENAENNDKVVDKVNWENQLLKKENKQLKEQLEASEKARKEAIDKLKTLGKFDGEKCTRSFKLWTADFNELISILDIDKGE